MNFLPVVTHVSNTVKVATVIHPGLSVFPVPLNRCPVWHPELWALGQGSSWGMCVLCCVCLCVCRLCCLGHFMLCVYVVCMSMCCMCLWVICTYCVSDVCIWVAHVRVMFLHESRVRVLYLGVFCVCLVWCVFVWLCLRVVCVVQTYHTFIPGIINSSSCRREHMMWVLEPINRRSFAYF